MVAVRPDQDVGRLVPRLGSPLIKFTHEEVEALLNMINEVESNSPISEPERAARDKLKRIYARQILSHEKKGNYGSQT